MAAQKRIHDTPAARVAAHREKKRQQGFQSFEITLPGDLAEKLRRLAKAEAVPLSNVVAALLADAPEPAE